MPVELYNFSGSLCSQKVRVALSEKGVEWKDVFINILKGDNFHPDYMKMNPKGVVPTLVHDGKVVINSKSILEYIDREFEGPDLNRGDPALTQAWLQLQDKLPTRTLTYGRGGSSFMLRLRRSTVPWKRAKAEKAKFQYPSLRDAYAEKIESLKAWENELWDAGAVPAAVEKVMAVLDTLNEALEKRTWLSGEEYTLADAAWTPVLLRLEAVGLGHLWTEGGRIHLRRYVEQVKRRPSYEAALKRYEPDLKKAIRATFFARFKWWIVGALLLVALGIAAYFGAPHWMPLLDG